MGITRIYLGLVVWKLLAVAVLTANIDGFSQSTKDLAFEDENFKKSEISERSDSDYSSIASEEGLRPRGFIAALAGFPDDFEDLNPPPLKRSEDKNDGEKIAKKSSMKSRSFTKDSELPNRVNVNNKRETIRNNGKGNERQPVGYILWHPVSANHEDQMLAANSQLEPEFEMDRMERLHHPHQPYFFPLRPMTDSFPSAQFSTPSLFALPPIPATQFPGNNQQKQKPSNEKPVKTKVNKNQNPSQSATRGQEPQPGPMMMLPNISPNRIPDSPFFNPHLGPGFQPQMFHQPNFHHQNAMNGPPPPGIPRHPQVGPMFSESQMFSQQFQPPPHFNRPFFPSEPRFPGFFPNADQMHQHSRNAPLQVPPQPQMPRPKPNPGPHPAKFEIEHEKKMREQFGFPPPPPFMPPQPPFMPPLPFAPHPPFHPPHPNFLPHSPPPPPPPFASGPNKIPPFFPNDPPRQNNMNSKPPPQFFHNTSPAPAQLNKNTNRERPSTSRPDQNTVQSISSPTFVTPQRFTEERRPFEMHSTTSSTVFKSSTERSEPVRVYNKITPSDELPRLSQLDRDRPFGFPPPKTQQQNVMITPLNTYPHQGDGRDSKKPERIFDHFQNQEPEIMRAEFSQNNHQDFNRPKERNYMSASSTAMPPPLIQPPRHFAADTFQDNKFVTEDVDFSPSTFQGGHKGFPSGVTAPSTSTTTAKTTLRVRGNKPSGWNNNTPNFRHTSALHADQQYFASSNPSVFQYEVKYPSSTLQHS